MKFKDHIETIQAIVTILAVLVGGAWTYKLFIKERKHIPHANIEQKVSHIPLTDQVNLIRIGVDLTNMGNSRLVSRKCIIRIQQISPILPCEGHEPCAVKQVNAALKETERKEDRFSWPLLTERVKIFGKPLDIEPGEKDVIDFEFVIPSNIETVRIYSYFRNEKKTKGKDEVGWSVSTYYDFRKTDKEGVK